MNYCAVMYQKYVYINPRLNIFRTNCAIACRLQVHVLPSSRVPDNFGPSSIAIRETRIMLAPVVMITILHVIDATY